MNKEQTKLFELLLEFDELCRGSSVRYYLTGDTLKYAISEGSSGPNTAYASVLMTGDNCRTFIKAFERKAPAERELEYWGNTKGYPDYTLRYVATDTTAFDMLDYLNYKTHGMYIEVEILRGFVSGKKAGLMRSIERTAVINIRGERPGSYWVFDGKGRLSRIFFGVAKAVKGEAGIRKMLFDFYSKECCRPSVNGYYQVCHNGSVIKGIKKELFEGGDRSCTINKHSFPIPAESDFLIRKARGKDFDTFVVDPDRSCLDLFKSAKLTEDDFRKIQDTDLRLAENEISNKELFTMARRNWHVVLQTDARFRMRKMYMPRKNEILRMYKVGDFAGLSQELIELDEEMERMLSLKRSFSFDNEIIDIYIHLLKKKGELKKAENVIRYMPESHLRELM